LLLTSNRPVIEVAVRAGFSSTSHFSAWYKRIYGVRPSDMRTGSSTKMRVVVGGEGRNPA
jgi:transcriptional regulator GlxA family with amidase domain